MLLRPIFPMFFFFSPTIDKTCKIYMSRRCCQEKGKNGPSCFFMTIFPVTDKYQHEQCHQICCVSHGTGQATASSHSPSPLWSLGTLPLRNCVAAVPERSTQRITLQSASTSNFSHSKQSIIFPYCPLKYVSATTSKKVKVLVILLICLSHWKCYSCSNRDDDFEELSLLNIFQAIKHLQRPVNGIFFKNRIANTPQAEFP